MDLYGYFPLKVFTQLLEAGSNDSSLTFSAYQLMNIDHDEEYQYGLSLLREAIIEYEKAHTIPKSQSKAEMPFFREGSRQLIGPEMGLYVIPFYENREVEATQKHADDTIIRLRFDYEVLAEHCLSDNLFLLKCKYDKQAVVGHFVKQLEREYDKVFYDEEHTGFARDSHFFSMLCNACLEVKKSITSHQKEWRLFAMKSFDEANYICCGNELAGYASINIPKSAIREITILYNDNPVLYGTFAAMLSKGGLIPGLYLTGMIET